MTKQTTIVVIGSLRVSVEEQRTSNNSNELWNMPTEWWKTRGPRATHLSDIATADMQMLCNIFPILSSQLMKRSSFKQFLNLKKNIYGMPVNGAWSFEQTLNGGQLGFTIGTILAIFDLRVTQMLPTKLRVNWSFESKEESKNRFSRWLPWGPSWKSDWHDFSYFSSTSHPIVSLTSLESNGLSVQEKKLNIDFQLRPWWPSGILDQNDFS